MLANIFTYKIGLFIELDVIKTSLVTSPDSSDLKLNRTIAESFGATTNSLLWSIRLRHEQLVKIFDIFKGYLPSL